MLIVVLKAIQLRSPPVWVALAVFLFGIGSCAMIALGRSELGTIQAASSRYCTTIALAYVGFFMIVAELAAVEVIRLDGLAVAFFVMIAAFSAMS